MEGRNTTGTSGDLQSAEYCPRLRGSHLLANRLSVTSWHSLASSWHTNMACSKESAITKKGYEGPNCFSSVNYVAFYRPECAHTHTAITHTVYSNTVNTENTCEHMRYSTDTRSHTHTHSLYPISQCALPRLPLMFLLETQLSSHGGQQMAQAAYSYLLLNIICFIHFAPQMHFCMRPRSQLSAETSQYSVVSYSSDASASYF